MPLKPGRRPNAIPRRKMTIYLRVDLAAELDLILLDPVRSRAKYGSWVAYIEELIERDLTERRKVLSHFDSIS